MNKCKIYRFQYNVRQFASQFIKYPNQLRQLLVNRPNMFCLFELTIQQYTQIFTRSYFLDLQILNSNLNFVLIFVWKNQKNHTSFCNIYAQFIRYKPLLQLCNETISFHIKRGNIRILNKQVGIIRKKFNIRIWHRVTNVIDKYLK